jgi:ABC-type lipoprotein release transport system permease subunit
MTRGNTRVQLLTIAMLILVYLNLVFTPAILAGAVETINDKTINTMTGDIIVQAVGEYPFIGNVTSLISKIETVEGVTAACARNNLAADLQYARERANSVFYAIDPDQDKKVFQLSKYIVEGSYLHSEDTDQILMGIQIAGSGRENLELHSSSLKSVHAGDRVAVRYVNGVERQYTVKGIFYTELSQSDVRCYITEKEFESISPLTQDKAASIHVNTEKGVKLQSIIDVIIPSSTEQILDARTGLRFQTWQMAGGLLRSWTDSFNTIISIIRVAAFVVAAITIFIITYVDLAHKRRQIGIQRAIGITGASIVLSYILRAIVYAIVGILAAALIFKYIIIPVEAKFPFHFPFGDVFLPLNFWSLVSSALILYGVAAISAFIPTWQTMKTKIIDAIWSM